MNHVGFKRNTPQLAAAGIKGIRIQLRNGSACLIRLYAAAGTCPACLQRGPPPQRLTLKDLGGFLFTCIFYPFSRIMRVSPLCGTKCLGNALISCIVLIASASSDNFGILQSAELIQIICEGSHHHFNINPFYSSNQHSSSSKNSFNHRMRSLPWRSQFAD
jgi:hypothetical protein